MTDTNDDAEVADEQGLLVKAQRKAPVLRELWRRKRDEADRVVTGADIEAAIDASKVKISKRNTANFLKDIVRRKGASALWPSDLVAERITARQVYGNKRVFEFVPFDDDIDEAFPDRFGPLEDTPIHDIQSISLPFTARRLGRNEETWLSQVAVHLGVIQAHLAFESPLSKSVRDVVHLQTGMKTQPEIDATFIVTNTAASGAEDHILLTCEAKRSKERLLEEQLRFQVREGMKATFKLCDPPISGVKPIGIQLADVQTDFGAERLIYVVEFETISRSVYQALCFPNVPAPSLRSVPDEAAIFALPLKAVSRAYYRLRPSVAGISLR